MKLTDVTRKPKKVKTKASIPDAPMETEKYPYGLRIRLQSEEIKALGIDLSDMSLKQNLGIVANGFVSSLEQSEHFDVYAEGRGEHKTLEIQITGLALGDPVRPKKDEPKTAGFTLKDILGK